MAITDRTRKILWGKSGNRCAICKNTLVVDATPHDEESLVADECHIISLRPEGPRHDPTYPAERIDSYENLLLLCRTHHKMVDDQTATFTVTILRQIRSDHEMWVAKKLLEHGTRKPSIFLRAEDDVNSLWRWLTGKAKTERVAVAAQRFLRLFKDHGIVETQIQQLLPQITFDKLRHPEALLPELTISTLDQAAALFKIRRGWLDGVGDRIYDCQFCYKSPQRFFEALADLKDEGQLCPVRALYSGKQLDRCDDCCQPLALLLVEKLRDVGEEEVWRYVIFNDSWDWGYTPSRVQLKAMARVMGQMFGKNIPLYRVEPAILEEVQEGKRIPRDCLRGPLITSPSLEDYAHWPTESKVAKECEEMPAVLEYINSHALESLALGQKPGKG